MNAKINWSFHRIDWAICFTEGKKKRERKEMISVTTFPTENILKVNNEKSGHCKTQGRENGHHFYSFQLIKVV